MSFVVEWVKKVKLQTCHVYEIKHIETLCLIAFQSTATINCMRKEFFNFTLGLYRHVSITLAYMPECFLGGHSTPFHATIKIRNVNFCWINVLLDLFKVVITLESLC